MENLDFNPNIELNQDEVTNLVGMMLHPGFKIEQKIWKACVNKFVNALINEEADDDKKVLVRHKVAKIAAQLYAQYSLYINNLYETHMSLATNQKPIDAGEGLDMGDYTISEEESVI